MHRFKKKSVAIAAGTLVVLAATGTAYAFWTGDGTGSGAGTTATGVGVTVNQTSTDAGLAPGTAALALSGTFTNGTTATVHVNSITVSISGVTGGAGTCTAANYTLASNPMDNGAAGWDVVPGTITTWGGATIQFANSTTVNQDGCKGATVALAYVTA